LILALFFLAGCLPGLSLPGEEEQLPDLELMAANVEAVLVIEEEEKPYRVAWSIENIGDLFIREYIITFSVFYPMEIKDVVSFEVIGNYLEISEKREGIFYLVEYDTPETVKVSWELFE